MRIHSLTTRFVLTLLLSTALPFLGFGWFVRQGMRERLEAQVVRVLLKDQATLAAEELDKLIDEAHRACWMIESAAARQLDDPGEDELARELDLQVGFQSDFQLVLLAGEDGRVLATYEAIGGDAQRRESRAAKLPRDVSSADWFVRTIVEDRGLVWVDRHLSPLLHASPERPSYDPADFSLGIAFQVFGVSTDTRGVVYALLRWQRVQDIVDQRVERLAAETDLKGVHAFVCAGDGTVLASDDRSRYGRLAGAPELVAAIGAVGDDDLVVTHGAEVLRMAGVARVGRARFRELDWRTVVTAPESELFAASRDFGRLVLLVTAVAAVALVLWSLFASRAILRPVRELSLATKALAEGDLGTRVAVRGHDELAELGRLFNAMAADLTASREQLRDAERQAAWAEMARQVAHEIKNPLTPMRMSAQLVQRARASDDPRLAELVDRLARTVLAQTDQLARIASDFRQFAGTPEPRRARESVAELLAEVREEFAGLAEQRGIVLRVELPPGDVAVVVDRSELRRVLSNLVQNAFDALDHGGRVEVLGRAPGADLVELFVRDDGPGIDAAAAERLFEPYFTTRSSGTGLGLAICRKIVEQHGGKVLLVASRPGRTEFAVTLPRAPSEDGDADARGHRTNP
ncbi:MAG: sensor histidine kinase [Planctomycetes bacterium]|nr:sensor histidine kinase [Planctomycetota bacterium]